MPEWKPGYSGSYEYTEMHGNMGRVIAVVRPTENGSYDWRSFEGSRESGSSQSLDVARSLAVQSSRRSQDNG